MATYSSGDSSKPHSPHRAYILNELKEAKCALALQDEAFKKLEGQLQKVKLKQDRSSHSIHRSHHSHRHSSRGSSNPHGQHNHGNVLRSSNNYGSFEKNEEWKIHKLEDKRQHVALPYSQIVNIPTFSGVDGGYVYLDWEAKVDHIFHVYKVQDDHKLRIVSLHFLDYAKE